MSRRVIVTSGTLVFLLGLLCMSDALPMQRAHAVAAGQSRAAAQQQQAVDCSDRKAVANAVLYKLRTNENLKSQVNNSQINVSFDPASKVISMTGWAVGVSGARYDKSAIKEAIRLAGQATSCERRVDARKLITIKPLQCDEGQQPCGPQGFCIPADQQCNLPPPRG